MTIPLLAAVPIASSLVNGAYNTIDGILNPSRPATSQTDFGACLARKMQTAGATSATPSPETTQSLIASQLYQGSLPFDQQIQLGQQVMNKHVQLVDSGGNSITGMVTGMGVQNGMVYLTVSGKSHPITALRSVLAGVNA
jgi:hypothetical protein